jgi:hypothetical protein
MRQEQEKATEEVSEVAPGVLRMMLPIQIPGLGHVNCYALVDGRGAALVDPGLPGPGTWEAIRRRLARAGLEPRHIHGVFVTHSHPDHFGGAVRIAKESGARVIAHRAFSFGTPLRRPDPQHVEVSVDDLTAHAEALERERTHSTRRVASLWAALRRVSTPPPWKGPKDRPELGHRLRWAALSAGASCPRSRSTSSTATCSSSPAASGSCCTRLDTPRITSACTIPSRARS